MEKSSEEILFRFRLVGVPKMAYPFRFNDFQLILASKLQKRRQQSVQTENHTDIYDINSTGLVVTSVEWISEPETGHNTGDEMARASNHSATAEKAIQINTDKFGGDQNLVFIESRAGQSLRTQVIPVSAQDTKSGRKRRLNNDDYEGRYGGPSSSKIVKV